MEYIRSILMIENRISILITIPKKAGDPTWYTSQWAHKMESIARSLGYNVIILKGDNVTYKNVNAAIERYKPRLYIHSGHGCPASLNGQNECIVTRKFSIDELMSMGEMEPEKLDKLFNPVKLSGCGKSICTLESNACSPICMKDTNVHLLKGSIIYAVSCHSAEWLGKCAIRYGIRSYVGYEDLLLFPVDGMRSQDMFGEVHLEFLKYLLEGYTVGEADRAMRNMEDIYIKLYKDTKWVGLPLLWNHIHRKVLGNSNTRIYE
jgi:hypothetical protein